MTTKSTSVTDRYKAWRADPDTPSAPSDEDAFIEGFVQALEWQSGETRDGMVIDSG